MCPNATFELKFVKVDAELAAQRVRDGGRLFLGLFPLLELEFDRGYTQRVETVGFLEGLAKLMCGSRGDNRTRGTAR